jgi:hypothetical protein
VKQKSESKSKTKPSKISVSKPNTIIKENNQDVLSQLEKLGELKEKGVLTDEEFQAQKAKLLSS